MTKEMKRPAISDLALGKVAPEEALRMLTAIENDPEASKELDMQVELLNLVSTEGKEVFEPESAPRPSGAFRLWSNRLAFRLPSRKWLVPAGALAAAVVLWLGLAAISSWTRPPDDRLAQIGEEDLEFRTRGNIRDGLAEVPALISERRFDDVVRISERFTRAYPKSDLNGFAHYSAGLAYLASARRSTLGLFPTFDEGRVERALAHLTPVLADTLHTGLTEDAMWLQAKGYLMLRDPESARGTLSRLVAMNGRRAKEALEMLQRMKSSGRRP
jgi:hypothetical protein